MWIQTIHCDENIGVTMYVSSSTKALDKLDKRAEHVRGLMTEASQNQITELWKQLDLSTIYHDWGLEGQVLMPDELSGAFDSRAVTDAMSLPLYLQLRSHKKAINFSREVAARHRFEFDLELFKEFHALFASDPEAAGSGQYRKDIPLHRSYFHEICHPSKISHSMKGLIDWMNDPEEAMTTHPVKWAGKFHFRFMRIFPFVETSGKIGRTMTNLLMIRQGYLPVIIHATERQRYYETIKQSADELTMLMVESEMSSLDAAEKFLRHSRMAC